MISSTVRASDEAPASTRTSPSRTRYVQLEPPAIPIAIGARSATSQATVSFAPSAIRRGRSSAWKASKSTAGSDARDDLVAPTPGPVDQVHQIVDHLLGIAAVVDLADGNLTGVEDD